MKAIHKYLFFLSALILLLFLFVVPSAKATEQTEGVLPEQTSPAPPTFTLNSLSFTYDGKVNI